MCILYGVKLSFQISQIADKIFTLYVGDGFNNPFKQNNVLLYFHFKYNNVYLFKFYVRNSNIKIPNLPLSIFIEKELQTFTKMDHSERATRTLLILVSTLAHAQGIKNKEECCTLRMSFLEDFKIDFYNSDRKRCVHEVRS